ncbi:hypothetical protein FOL47_009581 [Perkinsus chesapeaki]|uniref:Uncharacterized protein n=1 Tax=Perkinsus chesapeaki TaxID=330153 RepID=A0A7J6MRH6_PERCH|nr:hypothetical protein FOL47_009581 [Perkinsus chesapeaki]
MLPFPSPPAPGAHDTTPNCHTSLPSLPQFTKVSLGVVGRRMLRTMLAKVMKNDSHVRKECKKIARIREATVPELVQMASIAGLNNFVHSAKAFSSTLKQNGVWSSPIRNSAAADATLINNRGGVTPQTGSTGYITCSNFSTIQSSPDTFSTDYGTVAYSTGGYELGSPCRLVEGHEAFSIPGCTLTDLCLLDITSRASSSNGISEQDIIGLRTLTSGQQQNNNNQSTQSVSTCDGVVELSAPIYPCADNEELRLLSYCARAFAGYIMDFASATCQQFFGSPDPHSGTRETEAFPQSRKTSLGNNGRDVLRREITRKLQALPHLRDVANKIAPIRFATVPQLHQIAEAIGLGEIAVAIGEADQAQRKMRKKRLGNSPQKRRSSGGRSDVSIKEAICDSLLAYKWASASPLSSSDAGMQVINQLLAEGSRRLPEYYHGTESYAPRTSHIGWLQSPPHTNESGYGKLPLDSAFIEAASLANRAVVDALASASNGDGSSQEDTSSAIGTVESDNWPAKNYGILAAHPFSSVYPFPVDGRAPINSADEKHREYNYRDYSVMRQIPSLSTSLLLDIKHRTKQDSRNALEDQSCPVFHI